MHAAFGASSTVRLHCTQQLTRRTLMYRLRGKGIHLWAATCAAAECAVRAAAETWEAARCLGSRSAAQLNLCKTTHLGASEFSHLEDISGCQHALQVRRSRHHTTWSTARMRSRCTQTPSPRASGSCWWMTSSRLAAPLQQVMPSLPAASALSQPCAEYKARLHALFVAVERSEAS